MKTGLAAAGITAVLLAAAAEGRGNRQTVHIVPDTHRDAYVMVLDDHSTIMNESIEALTEIRDRYGDVLWFRRHGETYVVRERGKLDEARALFEPLRVLEPEQRDLARRQRIVDRKEEEIDRQRDAIEDRDDDEDRTDRDPSRDRKLRELDAALTEIRAESRRLDDEERVLDRRSEDLEAAAEAKLWKSIDQWIASGEAQRASRP